MVTSYNHALTVCVGNPLIPEFMSESWSAPGGRQLMNQAANFKSTDRLKHVKFIMMTMIMKNS